MEAASTTQPGAEAQVLQPRTADIAAAPGTADAKAKPPRRRAYRPSHRATFISLLVVFMILAINVAVLVFILRTKTDTTNPAVKGQVTISSGVLDKLGVNTSNFGESGSLLTVGPDAQFNGKVTIAGNTNISGPLQLNNKVSGSNASFTTLQGGNTSLAQLTVNGNSTFNNLNVRQQFVVAGSTQLQGPVTVEQLLTVANNLNVTGSLAVGGTFQAHNLTSTGVLTIAGHVQTAGYAPSVSAGPGVGTNGTVSISGNDAAGTVDVNVAVGGGNGAAAYVTFRDPYSTTPHVVVSPNGNLVDKYYIIRSATGFTIYVSGLSPAGYGFDYIVEQ